MIISHVRLFMKFSHVKIIAFQLSLFCKNYRFSKTVLYIINRKIHGCAEIPDLFLMLNMISHSFAALTRWISCSTLEINLVFPRTHACIILYLSARIILYLSARMHIMRVLGFVSFVCQSIGELPTRYRQ